MVKRAEARGFEVFHTLSESSPRPRTDRTHCTVPPQSALTQHSVRRKTHFRALSQLDPRRTQCHLSSCHLTSHARNIHDPPLHTERTSIARRPVVRGAEARSVQWRVGHSSVDRLRAVVRARLCGARGRLAAITSSSASRLVFCAATLLVKSRVGASIIAE